MNFNFIRIKNVYEQEDIINRVRREAKKREGGTNDKGLILEYIKNPQNSTKSNKIEKKKRYNSQMGIYSKKV